MAFPYVAVLESHVVQTYFFCYFRSYVYFFSYAVNEMEPALRICYSQWNAWEATSCTEVEQCGARFERPEEARYRQRMKYVVDVQAVDVFAGYDIDFGVPFRIECAEAFELPAGSGIDVGEIFKYSSILSILLQK